jgi:hypothetical protein
MTELATLHARRQSPDGTRYAATFAITDDGTLTRKIVEVNGTTVDNRPAVFRHLGETERRVSLADDISAIEFLAGVIASEGWMVTS